MLRISDRPLPKAAADILATLQKDIDDVAGYPGQVAAAGQAWKDKTSTVAKTTAFRAVRSTLAEMCVGPIRCAYCEDSLADEVEHIRPKNLFPQVVFVWANYLFACGPCNGPKSNRYGLMVDDQVEEFIRSPIGPIVPPGVGPAALIDPRSEDPFDFLELDLGGVTPDGEQIEGTFDIMPGDGLSTADAARALFSIDVLGLNREVMRVARENAFGGYRARLREYAEEKETGAPASKLARLQKDLLGTPHLTVFAEMRRQRLRLPEIDELFNRAPEAQNWPLIPDPAT